MEPITLQVGVKILLKNAAGKFLLIRRNPKKYPEVGPKWDIVGGRINAGAPLMENLKREVAEETKLEITSEPVLVGAQDILRIPGRHVVRLTYTGETTGEQIKKMSADELDIYFKELVDKKAINFL